jgi:hypothetical protein
LVAGSDGEYIIVRGTWLAKIDTSGNMIWNITYSSDLPPMTSGIATADGYVFVGYTVDYHAGQPLMFKVDLTGNMLWNKTYSAGPYTSADSVVATPDGGYAIDCEVMMDIDFRLIKTDSTGNVEWDKQYGISGHSNLISTTDGGYAVVGQISEDDSKGFLLGKLDALGNMQWNQTYVDTAYSITYTASDGPTSLIATSDGGYAIAGVKDSPDKGWNYWLIKTDANGNLQWNQTYGGNGDDIPSSVVECSDGGYAIAGYTNSFGAGNNDYWLVKTDASGNMQWNQTYGGANNDRAYSLVATLDGGYIVAGTTNSFGAGNYDYWLITVDSQGAPR